MMKKLLFTTLFLNIILSQTIDVNNSFVEFKVRNMKIRNVVGTIGGMTGTVDFDLQNADSAKFDVSVDLNTIDTDNEKRDKHLKNKDFFEIEKWPTINFKSNLIAQFDSVYLMDGNLTIKDVTKEVMIPFEISETDSTITFSGSDIINRIDYNVGVDTNNFKIGYQVEVKVVCVVNKYK